MTTITREIQIDAGHRLQTHGGKCANLHGHRYVIQATVCGYSGINGMVMDFAELKQAMHDVIGPYDHTLILERTDPLVRLLFEEIDAETGSAWRSETGSVMFVEGPPTVEFLAAHWARLLSARIARIAVQTSKHSYLWRLRVYETPNCFADIEKGEW